MIEVIVNKSYNLGVQNCILLVMLEKADLIELKESNEFGETDVPSNWYYSWLHKLEVTEVCTRLDSFVQSKYFENSMLLMIVKELLEYEIPGGYEEWLEFEKEFLFTLGKKTTTPYNF